MSASFSILQAKRSSLIRGILEGGACAILPLPQALTSTARVPRCPITLLFGREPNDRTRDCRLGAGLRRLPGTLSPLLPPEAYRRPCRTRNGGVDASSEAALYC